MTKSKATFFGFNPPFIGGAQNVMSRQEDERLIKNDVLQLLLTEPGERVMRPEFGVRLRSFVFEQSTAADVTALQGHIESAIAAFEPRVTVDELDITRDDERNGVNIRLVLRLKKDPKRLLTIEQFLTARA